MKLTPCVNQATQDFPGLVLENAYTNYKLVQNDRSWGVHNPAYVERLPDGAIAGVQRDYPLPGK